MASMCYKHRIHRACTVQFYTDGCQYGFSGEKESLCVLRLWMPGVFGDQTCAAAPQLLRSFSDADSVAMLVGGP